MKSMRNLAVITAVLLVCSACSDNAADREKSSDQAAIARGAAIFEARCSECHPRAGRGDYLKRIPVTLLTRRSQDDLVAWIQGSDKHREMPNFTDLSSEEKEALASYLLSQIGPQRQLP